MCKTIKHLEENTGENLNGLILKTTLKKMKRYAIGWEKIFVNHISDRKPAYRIYKEFLQLNDKMPNNKKVSKRFQ